MRYEAHDTTWFRLVVRGVGVFMLAWGVPRLVERLTDAGWWLLESGPVVQGQTWWYLMPTLGPALQVGLGVYLVMGAKPLVRYCCRGALGMCPACNYDVRNVPGATCPECGVGLPGRVPETPKS